MCVVFISGSVIQSNIECTVRAAGSDLLMTVWSVCVLFSRFEYRLNGISQRDQHSGIPIHLLLWNGTWLRYYIDLCRWFIFSIFSFNRCLFFKPPLLSIHIYFYIYFFANFFSFFWLAFDMQTFRRLMHIFLRQHYNNDNDEMIELIIYIRFLCSPSLLQMAVHLNDEFFKVHTVLGGRFHRKTKTKPHKSIQFWEILQLLAIFSIPMMAV